MRETGAARRSGEKPQQSQEAQRYCHHENRLHDLIAIAIRSALGIHDSPSRCTHREGGKLNARCQSFAGGIGTDARSLRPAAMLAALDAIPPALAVVAGQPHALVPERRKRAAGRTARDSVNLFRNLRGV